MITISFIYLFVDLFIYFLFIYFFLYQDLSSKAFLEVINRYVEVHATVGGGVSTLLLA